MIASKLDALIAFMKYKKCSEETIAMAIDLSINEYKSYDIDSVDNMIHEEFIAYDDLCARIHIYRRLKEWIVDRNNWREYDKSKNN